MRMIVPAAFLTGLVATPVFAADMTVEVEIPRLTVAEYHRPYTAIWIETPDQEVVTTLAVWYDVKLKNNQGKTWLKDIRQWWRRAGRSLELPADGVSGATRAPGRHQLVFNEGAAPLGKLAAGEYAVVTEAAREVGGREAVRVPFQWPPKKKQSSSAKGSEELGAVSVALRP